MHQVPTIKRVMAAAAGLAVILTGTPAVASARTAPADGPALQTVPLTPAAARSAAAGAPAVHPRATRPFSLIGATWTDPATRLPGTVRVRVRSAADGRWSDWHELESDGRSPADRAGVDAGGRGHTDPVWVGASDGVEARLGAGFGRTAALPPGLRLDLIDPDQPMPAPAPAAAPDPAPAPQAAPATLSRAAGVAVPPRPVPRMTARSGWQADETIVADPPEYSTDVRVMFVHHTAGTNNYRCADSARIVRGIQRYHVLSNGWNDIGYNFLVDRCGNLFEGRRGGVNRAVLGAHTMGFNSHASAIAVLGDYRGRGVSATVRTRIAQVAAYKLGAYGQLPGGRSVLVSNGSDRYAKGTSVTFNRISGHRDAGRTACPGDTLYGQLGAIRGVAGAAPAGLGWARMTGAARVGATYYTRGTISPLWTTRTPTAMLNRFDVYVDGKLVAATPNAHRRTTLRLAPGKHTVVVRGIHLSGRTASVAATVVSDATAPVFTQGPSFSLRTGSLHNSVPVRLGWTAADAGGLRSVALTSPRPVNLGVTARTWPGTAPAGVASTWALRAVDRAGNARGVAFARTPLVVTEARAARTGAWTRLRNPAHLGGSGLLGVSGGASMSWTFTGRSAALAASRTPTSGRLTVYADGQLIGTLDLRSARTAHRQAVWARNWGVLGPHTVKVVLEGTAGRPGAIMDGLVVLR
ncbi:N-acetylmuramoyl-L-alanine amidase [Jidongwangia harbinensis]|uniref:N-acetylmuramoyl-L-alanine amidase n=1 Tax=Jidongwangia harbinensis TaxID=2878561 RepID=UPI001CDA0A6C|nr:N-acetylmuramoyl-L-alanine amidase [Jidongwangia harbinensis]MCA2217716.1 N-acetylmuramoyl-L-alanine amidase [Jidongwangia harbinensis]